MENKIHSIEKGSTDALFSYFTTEKYGNYKGAFFVDEIREESKPITNYANLKVYRGYTDGKLMFEIESNSGLTIIYE